MRILNNKGPKIDPSGTPDNVSLYELYLSFYSLFPIWGNRKELDNSYIGLEDEQVLLVIKIDSNLNIENHINSICKKASQKLNALARITPYMNMQKRRAIMKFFAISQFSFCPLTWMFHSRCLNNKINSIHERALRITYKDNTSTFQELLKEDNFLSIHHRNLQWKCLRFFSRNSKRNVCVQNKFV